MLYYVPDLDRKATIRLQKAINGITDSNENQTIILKTWFQDHLPPKT